MSSLLGGVDLIGFNANPDIVTVSGFSSGSYAAMNFHIAYSNEI